jgi:HPt (histidine-containing phosphotransfer) domain-containing protein
MDEYDSRFDVLKTSSFDPRAVWNRVNGDTELLRELVEIFVQEYPGLLRDIATAIAQCAFDDVRKLSHKLKGSALQFSGSGAAALAEALERMGQEKSLQGAEQVLSNLERETAVLVRSLRCITSKEGEPAN